MQVIALVSIICNLALLGLCWLLIMRVRWLNWSRRGYILGDASEKARHAARLHHLRKANKGNRRQNHLVKRVRREATRREKIYAALIDGAEAEYGQPIWPDVKRAQAEHRAEQIA